MNVTIKKVISGFGNKGTFGQALSVGKDKLKHMATGFNVYPQGQRIKVR